MAKRAKSRTPAQIERDDYLSLVARLNAAFGTLTVYDSWDDVPTFRSLPRGADTHCHDCLTPHVASLYPTCGFCKVKATVSAR